MKPSSEIVNYVRKIAKRGTNAKLLEALDRIYMAGMEEGMRKLSKQLKERINAIQSPDNSASVDGEQQQPNSSESAEGGGANPDN